MVINPRLEKEMNFPHIHPTLTMTDPKGRVIDQVFQELPECIRDNKYTCDVYYNDDYNHKASQKELTLEDARQWWNTCVKKGYTRK